MRAQGNHRRLVLFAFLVLSLAVTVLSAGPAPATADATSAISCTPWLFDGCCTASEERQKRTCTDGTVSFTETRCVVVGECI
jgi:hypothetical protein